MTITHETSTTAPLMGGVPDQDLAQRHAPHIRFDLREPFLPLGVGYTVFYRDAPSPSFPRRIVLPPCAACAVEYAVWWDWDIQHLYELEHLWVYLDRRGDLVRAEGSWHGVYHTLWTPESGAPPLDGGRLVACAEPGKHAFAPSPRRLLKRGQITRLACGLRAGSKGVHVTPLFGAAIRPLRTAASNRLVGDYLRRRAFQPSYAFDQWVDLASVTLVPWANLHAWIPQRVAWWIEALAQQQHAPDALSAPHEAFALVEY